MTANDDAGGSSPKWGVADLSDFVLLDYDEGLVVFHRRSGETHVLNALAAEAFAALSEAALSKDQLTQCLIEAVEDGADRDLGSAADAIISRFELLGLVDRVDE